MPTAMSSRSRCPDEPQLLAAADLGEPVGISVDDYTDHRISTGDGMVGSEDDRLAVRRNLQCAANGAFAGKLSPRPPMFQPRPGKPQTNAVAGR
jgi:hypothetical protein